MFHDFDELTNYISISDHKRILLEAKLFTGSILLVFGIALGITVGLHISKYNSLNQQEQLKGNNK